LQKLPSNYPESEDPELSFFSFKVLRHSSRFLLQELSEWSSGKLPIKYMAALKHMLDLFVTHNSYF